MAICGSCGTTVADGTAFCPHCGASVAAPYTNVPPPVAGSPTAGLQENIAGALCYVLGWVTGLVFFFIDKRPFVRFHAAQSIVVFGSLHLLAVVIRIVFGFGVMGGTAFWAGFSLVLMLTGIIDLIALVLWIVLMITAAQGKRFEVPVFANIAKQLAGSAV